MFMDYKQISKHNSTQVWVPVGHLAVRHLGQYEYDFAINNCYKPGSICNRPS